MSSSAIFRATVFHTPDNPFSFDLGDPRALACHADGALLVREGRIAACGDYQTVRDANRDIATLDWRGGFILPGFVDAHVHFPQTRIIGAMGLTLFEWLDRVALPEEARMVSAQYAAETARIFVRALAAHGTTTAMVFGAHFREATATLFEAAAGSGLRIVSGLVVSDRLLRPELHTTPAQAYSDSIDLIQRYHKRGRLLYAVTPRFAYSASEAMLETCERLVAEHRDVRLQTHINENRTEVDEVARLFPWASDYLAVYERYGLCGRHSVMAHNVHATDSEIGRLAASGTAVAHCPGSNAALGSGIFSLKRHVAAGVTCALGTDVGAGLGFCILREAAYAYLTQRLVPGSQPLDPARLLYLATHAGARALGLEGEIGDFGEGKAADFVHVRPSAGTALDSVLRNVESPRQALASLITMAGEDTVREARVEGEIVFQRDGP